MHIQTVIREKIFIINVPLHTLICYQSQITRIKNYPKNSYSNLKSNKIYIPINRRKKVRYFLEFHNIRIEALY